MVKLLGKSIWDISVDSQDSWGWKNLMMLRDKLKSHIFHKIGNGQMVSVWYDRWCTQGPLCNFITRRDIYDARFKEDATVSELVCNGIRLWPDDWIARFPLLNSIQTHKLISDQHCLEDFRINHLTSSWGKAIWFSQCM